MLFEAPHRLRASLRDALEALGNRDACLARNLTKPHEAYQRGRLSKLIEELEAEGTTRGECTMVIAGAEASESAISLETAEQAADVLLRDGAPPRAVVTLLTSVLGVSRRAAYEIAHRRRADG